METEWEPEPGQALPGPATNGTGRTNVLAGRTFKKQAVCIRYILPVLNNMEKFCPKASVPDY